jgi:hypothetical protein
LTIIDVTAEHVYYKIDGSMHTHPMTLKLWSVDAKKDNCQLIQIGA